MAFPPFRSTTLSLIVAILLAGVLAPSAVASPKEVLKDWRADGQINGQYTAKELRGARKAARTDELEYSNLGTEIDRALGRLLLGVSPDGGGGGGEDSFREFAALANEPLAQPSVYLRKVKKKLAQVNRCWIKPRSHCLDVGSFDASNDGSLADLVSKEEGRSFPLVPALALLAVAGGGAGTFFVRRRRRALPE